MDKHVKQQMAVLTSSETNEWYTPLWCIEAAREVLGDIDLDPASCSAANEWIGANTYFTEKDDGLKKAWYGRVWLNCPYGKTGARSNQDIWNKYLESQYLLGRVESAISLTKCVPGYSWWEYLFYRWPVCFCRERIKFLKINNMGEIVAEGEAKAASNFWYFGKDIDKFELVFSRFGRVIRP